ncbi:MAG: hypothetical protein AAF197_04150 [Pseudomonadota bacterium]
MKHPTSHQFRTIISNFDKVLPRAVFDGHMKMRETHIDPECDTPMCHGGWYAVAAKQGYDHYTEGAGLMAKDLGFADVAELEDWARNNSDLWGGKRGLYMFTNLCAFTKDHEFNPDLTLKDIRNWWAGVHNRTHPEEEPVEDLAA